MRYLPLPIITSLMPMIIFAIPIMIFNFNLAKRKGRSRGLFVALGLIPIINFFSFLYLVSLTDVAIIEKLDAILERINR